MRATLAARAWLLRAAVQPNHLLRGADNRWPTAADGCTWVDVRDSPETTTATTVDDHATGERVQHLIPCRPTSTTPLTHWLSQG